MTSSRERTRERPARERTRADGHRSRTESRAGQVVDNDYTRVSQDQYVEGPRMGRIRVSGGATNNLGDFNSARVEVSLEMPFNVDTEDADEVYRRVSDWVEDKVQEELDAVVGEDAE